MAFNQMLRQQAGKRALVYLSWVQFVFFVTVSTHINVFNYTKLYVSNEAGSKEMSLGSCESWMKYNTPHPSFNM
jgi:hypothetical protein